MSGIAGIFALDASNPTLAQIEAMTALLERRGPDGTHIEVRPRVALGHTLLATTPEALVETLPFTNGASGCIITADARIDNRDDLVEALGLTGQTRTIGDGELILRAYLKWGDECLGHLLGDFAFAIFDPRSERLLCARDQIGMRQLIYHHDAGRRCVFATEPRAILSLPGVHAPLNHDRVVDYVGRMEGADVTSTFFRGVFRLPPAHLLIVGSAGLCVRRYWELKPEPELKLPSDEAYQDAFRAVFAEAVRCRLRSAGPVGSMLSGGIDSNSVAAMAAQLLAEDQRGPLATFSAIGPDPATCDETHAILAAAQSPLFAPTTINYGDLGAAQAELASEAAHSDEPFNVNMVMIRSIYRSAQRAGVKIVFDGIAGDLALISNIQVRVLVREGRIRDAIREARGERHFWGPENPTWRTLVAAAWQEFAPTSLRAMRFWRGRRIANEDFVRRLRKNAPFVDEAKAIERRRGVQQRDFDYGTIDAMSRVLALTHPSYIAGLERYDRVAAAYGVEPRDPFFDLRFLSFCLSLPRHQLQRDGWIKWILREVMGPIVAPEVT